jgi:hypothetical protein
MSIDEELPYEVPADTRTMRCGDPDCPVCRGLPEPTERRRNPRPRHPLLAVDGLHCRVGRLEPRVDLLCEVASDATERIERLEDRIESLETCVDLFNETFGEMAETSGHILNRLERLEDLRRGILGREGNSLTSPQNAPDGQCGPLAACPVCRR